jgi:hypothetical protein
MLKLLLRTLIILLVAGLLAGGIYLIAVNGGMNLIGSAGQAPHGFANGSGLPPADTFAPPAGAGFDHDSSSFSPAGLAGVAVQAGKIAATTALVMAIKAFLQMFKRRHKPAKAAAV